MARVTRSHGHVTRIGRYNTYAILEWTRYACYLSALRFVRKEAVHA